MAKFQVNYKYQGPNNKLRTASLILDADNAKEAVKKANDQLTKESDWFKITGTVQYT